MYSFSILSQITIGDIILSNNGRFKDLSIDSRSITDPKSTLFFAIKGIRHDGHHYIQELYDKGVRQFVIEYEIDHSAFPEANVFLSKSSIEVLQHVATYHRNQFKFNTIAITGSNGKTIVKEWLYQLLNPDFNIVKSPKSYNSQVGVPLSIWQINNKHDLGIFEAGISTIKEMEKLEHVIQPKFGIFTNIGSAHNEGFTSEKEKINEKLKLFSNVEKLIYCRDHEVIHNSIIAHSMKSFSWGKHTESNITILNTDRSKGAMSMELEYNKQKLFLAFPFTDNASIENAMHCVAYLVLENFQPEIIKQKISELRHLKMRLELKNGINNCQLIDDTYNNDLGGIRVALEFMNQQNTELSKTAIISDVLQSGLNDKALYEQINQLLVEHKITKLIGIGDSISKQRDKFELPSQFFNSTKHLLDNINLEDYNQELILIKGARSFMFEEIVNKLQQKIHGTVLEINLNALTRNLNFYRSKLSNNTKIMVMVKAFAYGSGSDEIANLLQHHHVDYLGVAYVDEGVMLRKSGIKTSIMVMNSTHESFDKLIDHNLEPEIYSFKILNELIDYVKNKNICIHIKIDTGMHRLGFDISELDNLIHLLKAHTNIKVKSIFTHLSGADEVKHNKFSVQQINLFKKSVTKIKSELSISPLIHVLNSAGILRFPEYHFDMVRLGIGLYGVDTNHNFQHELEPTNTLKTVVSQIKHINKGETIGYGRTGVALTDLIIATIAIGYADGYSRSFSNGVGKVLINGNLATVIGNVCMDMTMVNVTGIEVEEGDEVEIYGKNLSITELANQINTIPYELLTNVSNRVKRVFYLD